MKGSILALTTVITWAALNIINRYCVLKFDVNIIMFTVFLIFSGGLALLLIRQPVSRENWKNGVRYSWLYTMMQIVRSFFMISTFLYITSTETSLLFNIEIVITYLFAWLFFKRVPHKGDYWGICVILAGFVLFIFSLSQGIRMNVSILILTAATASCIRSIVVEETTTRSPEVSVRQKCGISGYTMFMSGLFLIVIFFLIAVAQYFLADYIPKSFSFLNHLPTLQEIVHPQTIIAACLTGFFVNSLTVYLYYATLKWVTSEMFMTFRAFQPALTFGLEIVAALWYSAMRPDLDTQDYILGVVIISGSLLILIIPSKGKTEQKAKDFIAD